MRIIQNILIVTLFFGFISTNQVSAQDISTSDVNFEVKRIYPYIVITNVELREAKSLSDINNNYKASWVKDFISVEIVASVGGVVKKSESKSDILNKEQKNLMNVADTGSDILVHIKYIPNNNLSQNDPKEINFKFAIEPDFQAQFEGGQELLYKYLQQTAISKIPSDSFVNYDLSMIKFTIGDEGEILDAHIYNSAYQKGDKTKINALLLKTINDMPCWTPAKYADGTTVSQEFVLNVGNMESCELNLLKTWRDSLDEKISQ